MENRGIGVFDSGFGGLTVVKELKKHLPNEKIYYFGDTARVPYGSKSEKDIKNYSHEIAEFLISKDIKLLVIACNTATVFALKTLGESLDIPVVGVIGAGARRGVAKTKAKKIGIIGTKRTVESHIYDKEIEKLDKEIKVYGKACPLFVPLIEEGIVDDVVMDIMIERYLNIIKDEIDTLILGCTHYPLIAEPIKKYLGKKDIKLVNPAIEVAREVEILLRGRGLLTKQRSDKNEYYVSSSPNTFKNRAEAILKEELSVEKIDLDEYIGR